MSVGNLCLIVRPFRQLPHKLLVFRTAHFHGQLTDGVLGFLQFLAHSCFTFFISSAAFPNKPNSA